MSKIINFLKTNYFIKGFICFILGIIISWILSFFLVLPAGDYLLALVVIIFLGASFVFFIISAIKKEKIFFIAFALFVALILLRYFIFYPVVFRGNKMEPYLHDGGYYIFQKINKSIKRGDIVLLPKMKVTMVIGLPGEKVSLKDGILFINDKPLENINYNFGKLSGNYDFIEVPEDSFFGIPTNQPTIEFGEVIYLPNQIHKKSEIVGKLFIKRTLWISK
jgi:signal peptidase I